jgi:hypothetical protein
MQKRGLSVNLATAKTVPIKPPKPLVTESDAEQEEGDNDSVVEYQGLMMVRRFRDLPEAILAKGSLDSAGVNCYLVDENMVRMDWFISNGIGGAKLMVRSEDLEAANEILAQPIPETFDYGSDERFEQPKCPRCGSINITFEALNKPASYATMIVRVPIPIPSPKWICENCGARWVEEEEPEVDSEHQEKEPEL